MRNVRILAASLLLIVSSILSAQIRESVVLVRPNPGEDRTTAFRNIADFFRKRNLGDLADYFDANSKNTGFGSGFLTRDPYGRLIAVTNRHVTAFSTAAKVAVTREDGTERAFLDCPVIYEDPDMDIAVLLLPQDVETGARILRLADSVPLDGEEVWTAGYPGLIGKPTWQLAKGNITNRRVIMDEWGPPEYEVYTQHSAPIDKGNSGGPLLTGDPRTPDTLRVVGVNTWGPKDRQNTFFAVHLDNLREALGRIPDPGKKIDPLPVVRLKTERLVEGINSNKLNQSDSGLYISTRLTMRQGWGSFLPLATSGAEAETWIEYFLLAPEKTMRAAVYHRIFQAIRGKGQVVSLASVEERTDPEGIRFVRSALSAGSNTYYLDWYEETGNWRIRSGDVDIRSEGLDGTKEEPTPEALTDREFRKFPHGWMVGVDVGGIEYWDGIGESTQPYLGVKAGYSFGISKVASLGAFLAAQNEMIYDEMGGNYMESFSFGAGLAARVGFGFQIDNARLYPFIEFDQSFSIYVGGNNDTDGIVRENTLGAGIILKLPSSLCIGGSVNVEWNDQIEPVKRHLSVFVIF